MSYFWLQNMAGRLVILMLCSALTMRYVSTMPRDANRNFDYQNAENPESPGSRVGLASMAPAVEDKPKSCFHFFVSRNMSALLADATRMLPTIRDHREREWILTFIHRIKSLAEHLRSHPNSRNYECLPTDDDETKQKANNGGAKGQQQPELYFEDDGPKRSGDIEEEDKNPDNQSAKGQPNADSPLNDASLNSGTSISQPSSLRNDERPREEIASDSTSQALDVKTTEMSPQDPSKRTGGQSEVNPLLTPTPDCKTEAGCPKRTLPSSPHHMPEDYSSEALYSYPLDQNLNNEELDINALDLYEQEVLKERIKGELLEEIAPEVKKLRAIGGTPEDLLRLWNLNLKREGKETIDLNEDTDFDYEETGAAAGDPIMHDHIQPDRTVAPSLGEVESSKEKSKEKVNQSSEPYDASDVLVQQLFDVKYNDSPSKTTKSLSDQNDRYLISSTLTPF